MTDAREVSGREGPVSTLTARICQVGGELRITSELWRSKDSPLVCAAHRDLPASPRCEACVARIEYAAVDVAWFTGAPVLCAGCRVLPRREALDAPVFLERLGRRRLLEIAFPQQAASAEATP